MYFFCFQATLPSLVISSASTLPPTSLISGTTVRSNDGFILRDSKNNDGAGTDLGVCRIRDAKRPQNSSRSVSHAILRAGDASLADSSPDTRQYTCYGCTLVISNDGTHWYEILELRQASHRGHARGTSYPVLSPKSALDAAFARTRTELCPSRKELP